MPPLMLSQRRRLRERLVARRTDERLVTRMSLDVAHDLLFGL